MSLSKEGAGSIPTMLWAAYLKSLQNNPKITKSLTSFSLMCLGDIIAQLMEKKSGKNNLDLNRTVKFASFGLLSAQMMHWWYIFLDKVFAGQSGLAVVLVQLAIDQVIWSPIFFVVYYVYMAMLNDTWGELHDKLSKELVQVSIASAKVWVPVQFITFKWIPPQFRVLWGNIVALGWNVYFSLRNNASKK